MVTIFLMYGLMGAIAGILAGLLGIGGGLVLVPLLVMSFTHQGLPGDQIMHIALGTSMATIVFTAVSSLLSHHRRGAVKWDVVRRITLGVLAGSYLGSTFASHLPSGALKAVFAVFLLFVAVQMYSGKKPKPTRQLPSTPGLIGAGTGIGVVSSLVGIGGGILGVPYMVWNNVAVRDAIGTAAALGFPIAVAGTAGYIVNGLHAADLPAHTLGFVYLPALAGIVAVSVLTAPFGARLAHTLPVDKLKRVFAVLLFFMGLKMGYSLL